MKTRPDVVAPGHPGVGYDPTAAFTDLQWYMFHQQNVAYFAAFSTLDYDPDRALRLARGVVAALPHLGEAYSGAVPGRPPGDDILRRVIEIEALDTLDGLPERWLGTGMEVYADPALPYFRIRIARLAAGPDAAGRRSFVLGWASHAFAEGTDSSRLSRSLPTAHVAPPAPASTPVLTTLAARLLAGFAAAAHLVASRLVTPHPGPILPATRVVPRRLLMRLARDLGVRQRTLLMALAAHVMTGAGTPQGKRHSSITYSTIDAVGRANRDSFMRMRMLLTVAENRDTFAAFARSLEQHLARSESRESGFNAEMNAAAIHVHRGLARRLPFLYGPRVFAFMPYDVVFGLIPPHRLAGPLMDGMIEPVYAGATMPGVNGCVVVPGRELVTFNFYMERKLLDYVVRLDALLQS